ncbi:hypothetical protein K6119_08775 [Paracrocinitomix mangrovi]|uniref:hypothetical protein n=1 Tax=Paracrocinitomix mangrovi TaxID=2862509 RepID=UPI001C8EE35C|nr:hypothetical protein [Paracrocinitomix mangrovi]UKN03604.1 hypothetical protein K6119_08775 [Paracrocinitomix mangrovi]
MAKLSFSSLLLLAVMCFQHNKLEGQEVESPLSDSHLENVDLCFYLGVEKLNKFKTIDIQLIRISNSKKEYSYQRGNLIKGKKPLISKSFVLTESEIDTVDSWVDRCKIPPYFNKKFGKLMNRPIITVFFKTKKHNVTVQWEGNKYPRNKVIQRLNKFKQKLIALMTMKEGITLESVD